MESSIRILGLDFGRHVGWCHLTDGTRMYSGVRVFPRGKDEDVGKRWMAYEHWLMSKCNRTWIEPFKMKSKGLGGSGPIVHNERLVDFIAFESPIMHHKGGHAAELAWGMLAITLKVASQLGIGILPEVAPSALKKWATCNGKASKQDMIRAAIHWFPDCTPTSDQADAIHVARHAWERLEEES